MSRVTRSRLAPIVAGLLVGLLAQQASATEEIVVYGSTASVVKVDPAVFRAEMDLVIAFSACPQDILPINGRAGHITDAHFSIE